VAQLTSIKQRPMEVTNKRADIPRTVLLRVLALALPDSVDVLLQPLRPCRHNTNGIAAMKHLSIRLHP
jgi:hypothetical protein